MYGKEELIPDLLRTQCVHSAPSRLSDTDFSETGVIMSCENRSIPKDTN